MKIGIDARPLSNPTSGVTNYSRYLVKAFEKVSKGNEFILYTPQRISIGSNPEIFIQKIVKSSSWPLKISSLLMEDQVEVFHQFFPHFPPLSCSKLVVTIHDLTFDVCPKWFPLRVYLRVKTWTTITTLASSMIIAISERTKRDLIKYYKALKRKVRVIYYGVDHELFKPFDDESFHKVLKKKYGIENKYVLYVGDINVRKNTERMLKAFYKFRKKTKETCKMVIVGKEFGRHIDVGQVISTLNLGEHVKLLGFISQRDLPLLYNGALFTVYPSLYEGFGLPLVESMACGTPVITSNISSMPEVVGDAGLTVDPYDTNALASAMIELFSDYDLRSELSKKSLKRAACFSWKKTAKETLEVYKTLGKQF